MTYKRKKFTYLIVFIERIIQKQSIDNNKRRLQHRIKSLEKQKPLQKIYIHSTTIKDLNSAQETAVSQELLTRLRSLLNNTYTTL